MTKQLYNTKIYSILMFQGVLRENHFGQFYGMVLRDNRRAVFDVCRGVGEREESSEAHAGIPDGAQSSGSVSVVQDEKMRFRQNVGRYIFFCQR